MSQQNYQQFDPVRSNPAKRDADVQAHRTSNGVDQTTIEALKAARNQVVQQVVQADKSRNENRYEEQNPAPTQASSIRPNKFAPLETLNKEPSGQQPSKNIVDKFLVGFAEEFVQKLLSIEKETAEVDEEIAKAEKIWLSLTEKKKQLEARRIELTKVKDKLKELDKEMSDALKSQSFDKLRIDSEQRRMGQ